MAASDTDVLEQQGLPRNWLGRYPYTYIRAQEQEMTY